MRIRLSAFALVSLLASLATLTPAHAQGLPCTQSIVTVSNAAGTVLFKVAATKVTPAGQIYELYYAGDFQATPVAIFRSDAGLQLSQPSNPTANCNLPTPPGTHLFTWLAVENGTRFAAIEANSLQYFPTSSATNPGNLVFYNTPLQPNAVLALPLMGAMPVAVVRKDSYIAPSAPRPGHPHRAQ